MGVSVAAVTVVVPDYDAGLAFYRDVMGFEVLEDTVLSPTKRWVMVAPSAGGAALLLAKADGPAQEAAVGNQTGGRVGFFLTTDDFEGTYARLLAAGVTFRERPRHERYGSVTVFEDPWGNAWDLLEPQSGALMR